MDTTLRVIFDTPAPAAHNMAADLHLLDQAADSGRVTLRFYAWQPPAITIGWMQKPGEVLDLDAMAAAGIEWVRRPTGGRAVLHQDDLTYSIVFPRDMISMGTTVAESYGIIAAGLIVGLRRAGIDADTHDSDLDTARVRREGKLPCFLAPNREEVMVGGRKLVGSAQKRTQTAVLQHGSIPLTPSFRSIGRYSMLSADQRAAYGRLLEHKCTCVEEIAPQCKVRDLSQALAEGMAASLRMSLKEAPWTEEEGAAVYTRASSAEFRGSYLA